MMQKVGSGSVQRIFLTLKAAKILAGVNGGQQKFFPVGIFKEMS